MHGGSESCPHENYPNQFIESEWAPQAMVIQLDTNFFLFIYRYMLGVTMVYLIPHYAIYRTG